MLEEVGSALLVGQLVTGPGVDPAAEGNRAEEGMGSVMTRSPLGSVVRS